MSAFFPAGTAVAVSLSFDDARESQLHGVRILDEHGIRASFYVLPSGIAAAPDRWSSVASAGHEIGNHTTTHPCSANYEFSRTNALENRTLDEIAADIDRAGQVIEDLLGVRPKTFAYPCGQSFIGRGSRRQSYVPLVAHRFMAGRGYGGETGNMPDVCDLAHLDAYVIDGLDVDALMSLVDRGTARGEWVIMAGHDIGDRAPQTVRARDLQEFCRRLARDDRVWVAPVVEVAEQVLATRAH
ncbi:polysaccharide deacetylase family protein [Streptomyces sp. NPDC127197]|uniref:polysaccharide deacetylase family protein n=1 Tax=Streptomyces sp. NPDC127197 TaxID=3345388 RepID=UPI00363CAC49